MAAQIEKRTYPSQDSPKFMVRFPGGLRDRLKQVANENRRSMNAEIVVLVEQGLERRNQAVAQ